MLPFVMITSGALIGVLVSEYSARSTGVWLFKPLASTGFIGAAVAAGALNDPYGRAILVALGLSWLGDVLLIPRTRSAFRLGLLSFLLAHVVFVVAFALRGLAPVWGAVALAAAGSIAVFIERWLRPHLDRTMLWPVRAYILVITVMVAAAAGAHGQGAPATLLGAALIFWMSDLVVARQRFVAPGFINRLVGLPLYYGAQLLFAWTASP